MSFTKSFVQPHLKIPEFRQKSPIFYTHFSKHLSSLHP